MALFDRDASDGDQEMVSSADAATRALSVTRVVENEFVARVYEKLANVYDFAFGPSLNAGRVQAIKRMNIRPGDKILEVGVGTGINALLYPRECPVTGVDLSEPMLEKARERLASKNIFNVRVLQMDAAELKFADESFDIVYAPYLISVVPDPVRVAAEMRRVCRKGGRIVILNHFRSPNFFLSRMECLISPLTLHVGFKADLDLPAFLAQADLRPSAIEKVNFPRIWSLVTCIKE